MSRIVQVANFVTPTSGGLRTTLGQLARGYREAGHEVVQVLPGPADTVRGTAFGSLQTLSAPTLPGTGYRVIVDRRALRDCLDMLHPDLLEVHDRTTLRGLGAWARRRGVPSAVFSHERLDRWLGQWLPAALPLERLADRSNTALAEAFDTVVTTTAWAAAEFERIGADRLARVPLGVDLDIFHPDRADDRVRAGHLSGAEHLLVLVSRLSREKRPERAIATVAELARRGRAVRLVVAGHGPQLTRLRRAADRLPVDFLGHVGDRSVLAATVAGADVLLAPGPIETFGLAALEGLALGTAAVVDERSALAEVVGPRAGRAVPGTAGAFADAVEDLLAVPAPIRTRLARDRAEQFPWSATIGGLLSTYGLGAPRATAVRA